MFSPGDYLVRIGRYFDRKASDPSALTFEEWTPPDDSSFVVNATEIRGVNFTMTPTAPGPRAKKHIVFLVGQMRCSCNRREAASLGGA